MKKLLLLSLSALLLTGCLEKSKGEKVGILVKCDKHGIFWSTNECELIRGGMNNASGAFGAPFHFTAENNNDVSALHEALVNQKEVHITYHQELVCAPWRTSSKACVFLDSVRIL